jgi:hypothetical protein
MLIGGGGMIVFVIMYAILAMSLADSRPVQQANLVVQVICYAVLGLLWILPVMPMILWMEGGRRKGKK